MPRTLGGTLSLTLTLGLATCLLGADEPAARDRGRVKSFLTTFEERKLVEDKDVAALKRDLGSRALPALAEFLPDPGLGQFAEMTMQQIDTHAATPYFLKDLHRKDGRTHHAVLKAANRAMRERALYVRRGSPPVNPNDRLGPYPENTDPYPFTKEIREAAIRHLESKREDIAVVDALTTLGLAGTAEDVPLIRKHVDPATDWKTQDWSSNGSLAAIGALARLGDKEAFDRIARELKEPARTVPAKPYSKGEGGKPIAPKPGQVVTEERDGWRLRNACLLAGFSMDRRFVPLLAGHLDDPPGQSHGDYHDPDPSLYARQGLTQIVDGRDYPDSSKDWKAWWREHAKEFDR